MPKERARRKLTITAYEQIGSFQRNGSEVPIYELTATDEHGNVIDKDECPLRALGWEPQLDTLAEYEVEPYRHKKYGLTFTVYRPKGESGLRAAVDELRREVTELRDEVAQLRGEVKGVPAPGAPASAEQQRQKRQSPASSQHASDDDIPF
jgi:hypothetical protein